MFSRSILALAVTATLATAVSAQTVRFETSVGEFDMVLNPFNDARLQEHTDNLLNYVESLRYHCTWINRADEGFVLQMGNFISRTLRPPTGQDEVISVETFDPVTGVPASQTGLTNSRGTVALALPGDGLGGTNRNAGTSSFFVNLGDNSSLDSDFTVFAVVPDLTTIDTIMSLSQTDLTDDFGVSPGNLAFSDVPLQDSGNLVFIERAFVLQDNLAVAAALNAAQAVLSGADPVSAIAPFDIPSTAPSFPFGSGNSASSLSQAGSSASSLSQAGSSAAGSASVAVPEPAAGILCLWTALVAGLCRARRR